MSKIRYPTALLNLTVDSVPVRYHATCAHSTIDNCTFAVRFYSCDVRLMKHMQWFISVAVTTSWDRIQGIQDG